MSQSKKITFMGLFAAIILVGLGTYTNCGSEGTDPANTGVNFNDENPTPDPIGNDSYNFNVGYTMSGTIVSETVGSVELNFELHPLDDNATLASFWEDLPADGISVPINWGGTATQGQDYTVTATELVFTPEISSRTVTVNIIADAVQDESAETITFELDVSHITSLNATPLGTIIVTNFNAVLPTLTLGATSGINPTSTTTEGASQLTFYIESSETFSETINFDASDFILSGSAVEGEDYTIVNIFPLNAGQTQTTMQVMIEDDALYELEETAILALASTSAYNAGTPLTLTIEDNDSLPVVTASRNYMNLVEGAAIGKGNNIFFTLDQPSSVNTVITLTPFAPGSNASATSDVYYPSTVMIPAGQVSATASISAPADTTQEELEWLHLNVSVAQGAEYQGHSISVMVNDPSTMGPQSAYADSMVFIWYTSEDGQSVQLPLSENFYSNGSAYDNDINFMVDWGDESTPQQVTSENDVHKFNSYDQAGTYTVILTGTLNHISFSGNTRLLAVHNLGDMTWQSFVSTFQNCTNLSVVNGGETSGVIDLSAMFSGATNVRVDTSNWNTSNVNRANATFLNALKADPDVSNWDVSGISNFSRMFENAQMADPDVSNWTFDQFFTRMNDMFKNASEANPDLSNWNFSKIKFMPNMFTGASSFSVENYTDMLIQFDATTNGCGSGGGSGICTLDVDAQYNSTAASARASLIAGGWTINDGGLAP